MEKIIFLVPRIFSVNDFRNMFSEFPVKNKKGNRKNDSSSCGLLVLPLLIPYTRGSLLLQDRFPA